MLAPTGGQVGCHLGTWAIVVGWVANLRHRMPSPTPSATGSSHFAEHSPAWSAHSDREYANTAEPDGSADDDENAGAKERVVTLVWVRRLSMELC